VAISKAKRVAGTDEAAFAGPGAGFGDSLANGLAVSDCEGLCATGATGGGVGAGAVTGALAAGADAGATAAGAGDQ